MKKLITLILMLALIASCASQTRRPHETQVSDAETFVLLWYVNGSDLESGSKTNSGGAFTQNLNEMLRAPPLSDNFQVLIFTGGTKNWQTDGFLPKVNQAHRLTHNGLEHLGILPEGSIASPKTLANFLRFALETTNADRYGLIFWDHGSGVPLGFGYDELCEPKYMCMNSLSKGLRDGLSEEVLAFIGFDACLMATAEVAAAVAPFGEVLIASQELEPFGGWNYKPIMRALRENPAISPGNIGKVITDGYFSLRRNAGETLTLSVVDLSKIEPVRDVVGDLAKGMTNLVRDDGGFRAISRARSRAKYFGGAGQSVDMVDLVHLARRFRRRFPEEYAKVSNAVSDAVILNRRTASSPNSNGISIYFPYHNSGIYENYLELYLDSDFNKFYQNFVKNFANFLKTNTISPFMLNLRPEKTPLGEYVAKIPDEWGIFEVLGVLSRRDTETDGVFYLTSLDYSVDFDPNTETASGKPPELGWLHINGEPAFAWQEKGENGIALYSALAEIEGRKHSLVAALLPNGKFEFLGAVPEAKDGADIRPMYYPLDAGAEITLLYPRLDTRRPGHAPEWKRGSVVSLCKPLEFELSGAKGEYGFMLIDEFGNWFAM